MARERITESSAKYLIEELLRTGDLSVFVNNISDYATEYGRFGRYNRDLFTEELMRQIQDRGITILR
jgi:hypothetical protein